MAMIDGRPLHPVAEVGGDSREVTRRLSEKILSAFILAYARGEVEIAEKLRRVLVDTEAVNGSQPENRGRNDPLGQVERWIEFVEARNQYRLVCENRRSEPAAAEWALETMKEAYQRWSYG